VQVLATDVALPFEFIKIDRITSFDVRHSIFIIRYSLFYLRMRLRKIEVSFSIKPTAAASSGGVERFTLLKRVSFGKKGETQ